jgi:hypothetical protein
MNKIEFNIVHASCLCHSNVRTKPEAVCVTLGQYEFIGWFLLLIAKQIVDAENNWLAQ